MAVEAATVPGALPNLQPDGLESPLTEARSTFTVSHGLQRASEVVKQQVQRKGLALPLTGCYDTCSCVLVMIAPRHINCALL